ncbi:MAG: hypothetical protein LUE27_09495 [Clostridia bacterium]|nr:hypothetical protein [Clostridia bacterium]
MGGRGKGTPNKITSDLKGWIAQILEGGRVRFEACLNDLEPQEYIRVYTGLLNYVLPKQASVNPDSVLEKEKAMLQEFVLSLPDEMVNRVAERLNDLTKLENENKIE